MKTLLIILLISLFTLVITFLCYKKMKKKYSLLKMENDLQKKQINELLVHSNNVNKIRQEKSKSQKKLKEAKTDEDVKEIVDNIVTDNNNRVQKSTTRKSSTSTKTRTTRTKES